MKVLAEEFQAKKRNLHKEYVSSPMKTKHCHFQGERNSIKLGDCLVPKRLVPFPRLIVVLCYRQGRHSAVVIARDTLVRGNLCCDHFCPCARSIHTAMEQDGRGKKLTIATRRLILSILFLKAFSGVNDHW